MEYSFMEREQIKTITILGAGKLGQAIAKGFVRSGKFSPDQIALSRRNLSNLDPFSREGFQVGSNHTVLNRKADLILLTVGPKDVTPLLEEIKDHITGSKHILASTATGISIDQMTAIVGREVPVIRVMPNTAAAIGQSMTCLSAMENHFDALTVIRDTFNLLGKTKIIQEDLMAPATALCASGLAFFLRSIRAASQGGIEIGFHAEEAILLAAQTAQGASSLLIESEKHPESEIDQVTTPRGITIAGLNEMEHQGFSSAMIKAIVTSANKIEKLGLIDKSGC